MTQIRISNTNSYVLIVFEVSEIDGFAFSSCSNFAYTQGWLDFESVEKFLIDHLVLGALQTFS